MMAEHTFGKMIIQKYGHEIYFTIQYRYICDKTKQLDWYGQF